MNPRCLAFLLAVPLAAAALAATPGAAGGDPALSELFAKRGVTGSDMAPGSVTVWCQARSQLVLQPISPVFLPLRMRRSGCTFIQHFEARTP
jgi:hypothetical protein